MAQLVVMTDALTRGLRAGPWPGPGVTEPRLQHVADTFARAAQLVHGHAARSLSNNPAVRADVDAARTRIIHTLYVTSHGVRLAVAAHVRHRERVQSARGRTSGAGTLAVARPVLARLDAFELVAGAYVARTFPAALNGEHREVVHTSRVGEALAGWDVHAHRALATNPTPGHLRLVAMTQELVLRHAAHVLRAAAATGAIDPVQHATRLARPLEESRVGWAAAAARWSDLAARSPRPDAPALVAAAAEVRATLRAVTVDGPGPATAAVVATRADLPATVRHLATALSSSSDLAHVVRDVSRRPPGRVPGAGRQRPGRRSRRPGASAAALTAPRTRRWSPSPTSPPTGQCRCPTSCGPCSFTTRKSSSAPPHALPPREPGCTAPPPRPRWTRHPHEAGDTHTSPWPR